MNSIEILLLLTIFLKCVLPQEAWGWNAFIKAEDKELNFTGLAHKYRVPYTRSRPEEHDVVTEDGYVLKLFRIPGTERPILLQHGLLDSADIFIIRGYNSLAVTLAANGYDVWAGNIRGNKYSRRHRTLNPDTDDQFWDFSIHEHGYFDLPAMIDFILYKTCRSKLDYIGHSQGTSIAFILGSTRPEYNQKIGLYIALAPVAFLQNVSIFLKKAIPYAEGFDYALKELHKEELGGANSTESQIIRNMCSADPLKGVICLSLVFTMTGFDYKEIEPSFIPIYFSHYPSGTSRKNLMHFIQVALTGNFAQYNYGVLNYARYGTMVPPLYDFSRVTVPTVLIVSKNDGLSSVEDTNRLKAYLPNVVEYMIVADPKFNHLDFVLGRTSYYTLFPKILAMLQHGYNSTL